LKQVSLFGELQNALEQIEALKKEVSTLDVLLEECKMDWSGDVTQIKAEHKHEIEALQADAERYRLGREAEYVGLMPTFRTGKTWAEAMDAAYDAHIAARKGNV
jgi:predicted RNase H-like nuclease (RuvC/YqgF family)